jgi:WD40 repeat protein
VEEKDVKNILEVVEKNEKYNGAIPDKVIQSASQFLSLDFTAYDVDTRLTKIENLHSIARKLTQENHKLQGKVQCVNVLKSFLFVGNSSGIIRVFDLRTQKEMKPLLDLNQIKSQRVTAMDINGENGILISGYKGGGIALWDLLEYKLLKYIPNHHESDVTKVRIYLVNNTASNISLLSSEDTGAVRLTEITKKPIFGGYNVSTDYLFKNRIKGTTAIEVYQKNK